MHIFIYVQANDDTGKSNGDGDTIGETGNDLTVMKRDVSRKATRWRWSRSFALQSAGIANIGIWR